MLACVTRVIYRKNAAAIRGAKYYLHQLHEMYGDHLPTAHQHPQNLMFGFRIAGSAAGFLGARKRLGVQFGSKFASCSKAGPTK